MQVSSYSSPLVSGTTRLFAERTASVLLEMPRDEHGFLQPSSRFFGFERLLDRPCSLIVAPPWTGKTFTARRIDRSLSGLHLLTDLEARLLGQPIKPDWWNNWKRSQTRATWIIDALDEGQRREEGLCPCLIGLLRELSDPQRDRLRLLIFAREGDLKTIAPEFEGSLREVFQKDFFAAELLPLDANNSKDILESQGLGAEDWTRILYLIKQNGLQAVAAYPAALLFLAKQKKGVELSVGDVWEGVLQQLLEEHHYHSRPFQSELESRFAGASRIAAMLTLAGEEELAETGTTSHPTLSETFPLPESSYTKATREAAREALRSGMFHATAEGFRFLHKNVREWMAAFGMAFLPLAKLRPILQNEAKSLEAPASIRPEFGDLARLLGEVHDSADVRAWIYEALGPLPSDLYAQTLGEVRLVLDRLEELAVRGGRLEWIKDTASLRPLMVPGIGEELARRLKDTERHPAARTMLLELGTVLTLDEVLSAAVTIVPNVSQDEELRSWCALSIRRSERLDLLQSLEPFIKRSKPETRVEKEIVSTVLGALVEKGVWPPSRAFRFMPRGPASPVIDATRLLPHVLERHMTVKEAEDIVSSLDPSEIENLNDAADRRYREGALEAEPRWESYAVAVRKLASVEPVDVLQLRRLFPFALSLGSNTAHHEGELITALEKAFRSSEIGRRELFETAVKVRKTGGESERQVWWWTYRLLSTEDLEWLIDRLVTLAEGVPDIWQVALLLSEEAGRRTKQKVRKLVQQHASEAFIGYGRNRRQQQKWLRQERQKKEKEEARKRHIEEIDRELLADPNLNPHQRLWQLSWANFSDDTFRPRNLVGTWSDVPTELQRQVVETCATLLDSVAPTPVPEGSSFSSVLQYEAQAFVAMLKLNPKGFELTRERIQRWLPAVLRTFQPERGAILEHCLQVAREITEDLLLEAVARDLREDNAYSILLQDLPASLWTEKVTHWVAEGIEGEQPAKARPRLLELLAKRRPEEGLRTARALLSGQSMEQILRVTAAGMSTGEPDDLGIQALKVLLALAPEEVWPRIEEGALLAGERFLDKLEGLTAWAREGLQVRWQTWPTDRISRLARLLFAVYPPENDPPENDGLLSPADDLRRLRYQTLEHLVNSKAQDAPVALEAAKEAHPKAREVAESLQASYAANALLTEPVSKSPEGISVAEACRLLDEADFRLIRSTSDLLEVVVEELGKLEQDLGYDHPLLYCPSVKGAAERRRREEALQAYVHCRLRDRLPGKVLDKETQVKLRRRMDIRVIAPVVDRRDLAKIVIEVKWSDNSDNERGVSTSLTEQLGKKYLLSEGLTHGVFLVGWTGKLGTWKKTAGPRPQEKTAASLAKVLQRQADEFGREHSTIDIRPTVWDVRRSSDPGPNTTT